MKRLDFPFDIPSGSIAAKLPLTRRLSDLKGIFADPQAYRGCLEQGDPVVYTVASVEDFSGVGDLHFGLGCLMPGRVGAEYYMTRGHRHTWREAAEVYIGLTGSGLMLLDGEDGQSWVEELGANRVVYVPGGVAHRTVNTSTEPLRYWGVYPARAGHDYESIQLQNFKQLVLATPDGPKVLGRAQLGGGHV